MIGLIYYVIVNGGVSEDQANLVAGFAIAGFVWALIGDLVHMFKK